MVIATQNPIEQAGTYRLPEAQLDRFLMKTSLGYPDHDATVRVLRDAKTRDRTAALSPVVTAAVVNDMAALADEVHVDDAILDYLSRIAEETRRHVSIRLGLSVRGCLAFIRCAKTWAISQGRNHVIPDDIKLLAQPVLNHRLLITPRGPVRRDHGRSGHRPDPRRGQPANRAGGLRSQCPSTTTKPVRRPGAAT
jgi:MoxR-like ATPase